MKGFVRKTDKKAKPLIEKSIKAFVRKEPIPSKVKPNLQFRNRRNIV